MTVNVLDHIKRHVRRAGIRPTASLTVHTFCKSYGQDCADAATPIRVLR